MQHNELYLHPSGPLLRRLGVSLEQSRQEYLVPEHLERSNGIGPSIELGEKRGELLLITLGINHVLEQESLTLFIWGSTDGESWGLKPLGAFNQKDYCGVYVEWLNLAEHPEVRYLRASWQMNRWRRDHDSPLFGFFVSMEASGVWTGKASVRCGAAS